MSERRVTVTNSMVYGYARVSTEDQKLNMQLHALKAAGCGKVFKEKVFASKEWPELDKMISLLQKGDTVVIWKLDRLGRSLWHLIDLVKSFEEKKVKFTSLHDNINTQTAQDGFILNLFASLAEFERDIIRERTQAGLSAARARGRKGGRPKGLSLEARLKAEYAKKLHSDKTLSIDYICKEVGVSRRTLYNYIKMEEAENS
jgi:DNA invertase Pin-like site-specific DNA recombinase